MITNLEVKKSARLADLAAILADCPYQNNN